MFPMFQTPIKPNFKVTWQLFMLFHMVTIFFLRGNDKSARDLATLWTPVRHYSQKSDISGQNSKTPNSKYFALL